MSDVTLILNALERGDSQVVDKLLPAVYQELRQLAAHKLAHERPGHTLQATALVHEAYLRLAEAGHSGWHSRTYFYGTATEAMRRILIEHARRKRSKKRGGDRERLTFMDTDLMAEEFPDDLIAMDEAIKQLEEVELIKAELVKMLFLPI